MKLMECSVCGHIEFNAAPDKCLVCRSAAGTYSENDEAVKNPADPANLTDGDKKHIPQITVVKQCGLIPDTCTDVHVKVGEINHVMTPEHFIQYIDAYVDYKFMSRIWLAPGLCHPAVGFHVNAKSGKFTTIESCNVHGKWMAETDL